MKKYPNLFHLHDLMRNVASEAVLVKGVGYIPARPLGFASFGSRCKCAWLVFTGRADAVVWGGGQ